MKKVNILIACGVMAAIPLLMLLQQFLMPRGKSVVPPHMKPRHDAMLYSATENALLHGQERAAVVALAAGLYMRKGDLAEAEKWCRLGALEYRHPSIMVFYGDFLAGRKRHKEALRWYKLALRSAKENGAAPFAGLVEGKIRLLTSGVSAK